MNEYLSKWLYIIENMHNDNTYKLAWGRAILECIHFKTYQEDNDEVIIYFDDISKNMIKYYWNQIFFFKLKQAPYKNKEPVICKFTKELIDRYIELAKKSYPVWFNEGLNEIINSDYKLVNKVIKKVSKTLHENVCWRFKNINQEVIDIYRYSKEEGSLIKFNKEEVKVLDEYNTILSKLLNFKWVQLLEGFNYAPNIANKVNGISNSQLKRNSLQKYKEQLLKQFKDGKIIDFYTGKEIDKSDISIDHVIPWSFMYSDDIWNLVITSKSYNSSKSNMVPNESDIERLKERNLKLLDVVDEKYKNDIKLSEELKLVDKFYYDCGL